MMGYDLQLGKDSILFQAVSREACIKNYERGNELYCPCLSANKSISSRTQNRAGAGALVNVIEEVCFSSPKSP